LLIRVHPRPSASPNALFPRGWTRMDTDGNLRRGPPVPDIPRYARKYAYQVCLPRSRALKTVVHIGVAWMNVPQSGFHVGVRCDAWSLYAARWSSAMRQCTKDFADSWA